MEDLVNTVLSSMSNINKPQRLFMVALFKVLMVFQGKANFRNMSRYSALNEKRLSRWYRRPFEFAQFNTQLLSHTLLGDQDCIAAIDASFVDKAGKQTDGLGWFYNGSLGQSQRGLEVSMISILWTFLGSNSTIVTHLIIDLCDFLAFQAQP